MQSLKALAILACMLMPGTTFAQMLGPSEHTVALHAAYQEMMKKNGYTCPCSANMGECRPTSVEFVPPPEGEELTTILVDIDGNKCPYPLADVKQPEFVPPELLKSGAHACAYPITVTNDEGHLMTGTPQCSRIRIGCVFFTVGG